MTHVQGRRTSPLDLGAGDGAERDLAPRRDDEVGHLDELALLLAVFDYDQEQEDAGDGQLVFTTAGLDTDAFGGVLAVALEELEGVGCNSVQELVAGCERLVVGGTRRDLDAHALQAAFGHGLQHLREQPTPGRGPVEGERLRVTLAVRVFDLDASGPDEVSEHVERIG